MPAAPAASPRRRGSPAHPARARTIAVANWKGGSGKTATALGIGYALAEAGRRVLLVDLDPQANLSDQLGVDETDVSVADVLLAGMHPAYPDPPLTGRAVIDTEHERLWLLPAPPAATGDSFSSELAGAEMMIARDPLKGQRRLARGLEQLDGRFDVVIVDAPPQVGMLTTNALVAADRVVVAAKPERHAMKGFASLTRLIQDVAEGFNPDLALLGAVVIGDRRHIETRRVLERLDAAGVPLLGPLVPLSVAYSAAAQERRRPLGAIAPSHPIALAYRDIARVIEEAS
jgi:chromosome partitioning protein